MHQIQYDRSQLTPISVYNLDQCGCLTKLHMVIKGRIGIEELLTSPVFLLTIDTEEEWDWHGDFPKAPYSTHNINEIPAFQDFCRNLGVKPTYLVDYAVAANTDNAQLLKTYFDNGECDIGAHMHPWCTPPYDEIVNRCNSHSVNLPDELVEQKIVKLTSLLQTTFGIHPYSYRAGRWGIKGSHLQTLSHNGYRVDTSVRPYYQDTGFDYRMAPSHPYWPSFDSVVESDPTQRGVFEVPVSSGFSRPNFEQLENIYAKLSTAPLNKLRLIGVLWHLGLMRKIAVTPEGNSSDDICRCIDASVARGDRVINMFFHSSDLLPGCTPYVSTAADKTRFMNCVQICLEHVRRKHNAIFLTMRDIRKHIVGTA